MKDVFASVLLSVIIILFAGQSVAGNLDLWMNVQGLTTNERRSSQVAAEVFDYIHERNDIPADITGFTAKENDHMIDVKWTYHLLEGILFISLWIFLALLLTSEHKSSMCLRGSGLALITLLLILVIPFDSVFVWFHKVFFAPGTWTFEGGLMIASFPYEFFIWLAQVWWMRAFSSALALALVSFIIAKKSRITTLI